MTYELWYWPGFPGRGEFVRLALEAGDIPYRDIGMERDRDHVVEALAKPRDTRPFAPPFLVSGDLVIGQTANILLYLGEKHELAPASLAGRSWINQCQLTIFDILAEVHHTHHPVAVSHYYEEQKVEAMRAAQDFRDARMPKYLSYFENILAQRGRWLGGETWTYADLSLFHLIEGLRHAFPRRMQTLEPGLSRLRTHHDAVAALPHVALYLASPRRQRFGSGVFRDYPELDGD